LRKFWLLSIVKILKKLNQIMEKTKQELAPDTYDLILFVTGMSVGSIKAIANIKEICDKYLPGRYALEIIDIHKYPESMYENDIIASPTLIKRSPGPMKKLLGDLSNRSRVLNVLSIREPG
jgi:circadian clock protein KaiB